MGLHDRLKERQNGRRRRARRATPADGRRARGARGGDSYAELKTRVHHACIAKLGAELFKRETTGDLPSASRAVTEQLALDRTPLTREERRQIVREITDDILGYGPLEPFLRDDSVTEVMVNATTGSTSSAPASSSGRRRVRRQRAPAAHHRQDRLAGRPPRRRGVADGRRAPARRQPRQRDHPAARAAGPTLTIRKFSRDPYTMDDLITFGRSRRSAAQFLAPACRGS
jgi:pilus assembly protein CpaF